MKVWLILPGWPAVEEPAWLYTFDGSRTGTLRFDESAGFTKGMTCANGWFYLLSNFPETSRNASAPTRCRANAWNRTQSEAGIAESCR